MFIWLPILFYGFFAIRYLKIRLEKVGDNQHVLALSAIVHTGIIIEKVITRNSIVYLLLLCMHVLHRL